MASTPTNTAAASPQTAPPGATSLLIHLTAVSPEAVEPALANLALAFPGQSLPVAVPDIAPNLTSAQTFNTLRLLPYSPTAHSTTPWVLTAADYVNTFKLAQEHNANACLVLGAESQSLSPDCIRNLAAASLSSTSDLVVSYYHVGPREALINSAILYPVTRALFGARPRFPLAIDLGLSLRMAESLATPSQRFTAAGQDDAILWPVSEAAVMGYTISEADVPTRAAPPTAPTDLNALFALIAGSLFADVDSKASFWQRVRNTVPPRTINAVASPSTEPLDVSSMLQSFNLAYSNLQEIWALVLPPHTLLGLKRLSLMPPEAFRMADNLWARIVYDFILAYRLRTINRGHLLGALTPLYLAWVASHLTLVHSGVPPERHIEELAVAFETDKPYLVSRWRWPDRFNP
jgi:glucosylglycerate synthase